MNYFDDYHPTRPVRKMRKGTRNGRKSIKEQSFEYQGNDTQLDDETIIKLFYEGLLSKGELNKYSKLLKELDLEEWQQQTKRGN